MNPSGLESPAKGMGVVSSDRFGWISCKNAGNRRHLILPWCSSPCLRVLKFPTYESNYVCNYEQAKLLVLKKGNNVSVSNSILYLLSNIMCCCVFGCVHMTFHSLLHVLSIRASKPFFFPHPHFPAVSHCSCCKTDRMCISLCCAAHVCASLF